MKPLLLNALLLLATTLTGCSDDTGFTPTLPAITQTGENTFGCYVDGKLLKPRNGTGTYLGADRSMNFFGSTNNEYNEIRARDFKSNDGKILDIQINNLFQNGSGNYTINESNCERFNNANQNTNIRLRLWNSSLEEYNWYCSIENGGVLIISRFDLPSRIVSGTFYCNVVNEDYPNDIIEITEGRFDIKWDTLPNTTFP